MNRVSLCSALFVLTITAIAVPDGALRAWAAEGRTVVSLDGTWRIAQGTFDQCPDRFEATVPVPGLVDMARPAFQEVGTPASNSLRKAFWYRRTFTLDGPLPECAALENRESHVRYEGFPQWPIGRRASALFHAGRV